MRFPPPPHTHTLCTRHQQRSAISGFSRQPTGDAHAPRLPLCRPNLIKGFMQLYSVEQSRSQALEAHSAAFSVLPINGKDTNVIVFTTKTFANGVMNSKVHCIALGGAHKKQAELFFPAEFVDDFPVSLNVRCALTQARPLPPFNSHTRGAALDCPRRPRAVQA